MDEEGLKQVRDVVHDVLLFEPGLHDCIRIFLLLRIQVDVDESWLMWVFLNQKFFVESVLECDAQKVALASADVKDDHQVADQLAACCHLRGFKESEAVLVDLHLHDLGWRNALHVQSELETQVLGDEGDICWFQVRALLEQELEKLVQVVLEHFKQQRLAQGSLHRLFAAINFVVLAAVHKQEVIFSAKVGLWSCWMLALEQK